MDATAKRRVVITGMSITSPLGTTLDENLTAWREGYSKFSPITRFNSKGSAVTYAGECKEPDLKKLPDRKVTKILTRKDTISLLTTLDAAKSAGIEKGKVDPQRIGMYVGAGSTQISDLTPYFLLVKGCVNFETGFFDTKKFGRDLLSLVNPLVVLQTLMNNGLCFASMTLDLRGVNTNFMDFQVSGLRAIGEGFRSIATGRADIIIAGGVASSVEPFVMAEGVKSGFLAKTGFSSIDPDQVVRPYDQDRCGTILSEGSAYIVLEDYEHAKARGANILAEITGYALSNDGKREFMVTKESPGLVRSIKYACEDSQIQTSDIGFISGHGSGALAADAAECWAYEQVFNEKTPLFSLAGSLGDMSEPSGVASVIASTDSLQKKMIPPTKNFSKHNSKNSMLDIQSTNQSFAKDYGLVTSRSFLGLSAALIIKRM